MPFPQDVVLPQGSLVLVTGITGYLGCIIGDELLAHGYRVRGTARDPNGDKASWMPKHFDDKYGRGKFEMVQVEDMEKRGCFDEAVKGCDGIVHVASVVQFGPDPNPIITPSLAFLDNILTASEKEPSIKRFVYTSSSAAATQNTFNEAYDLTEDMWADWAVEKAWAPPPYTMERALSTYLASKVQTEQKLWRYAAERKPHFTVNSVLPDFVVGPPVNAEKQGYVSSMGVLKQMFEDSGEDWKLLYPQWCVDAVDTALLHVAALLHPQTQNERIFAFAHPKTSTDFIRRLKKMYPERQFPEPPADEGKVLTNVTGREKAENLLKWMGRPGWRLMDEMLKEACDSMLM